MQQIDLYDELIFEKSDEIAVNSGIKEEIILKAIAKMKGLFDIKEGISVSVSKNIPIAAGFGGGSADAAATLKALNELWGLNLKIKDLIKIGDDIGADVPFFIAGKTCFAAGKGRSEEIINLPEMNILAVN